MNEKINSLRLDAGISTLENDPRLVVINKNGEVIDPMIGLEKFAELIIRECAEVALREDHDPYECILSHFGLKPKCWCGKDHTGQEPVNEEEPIKQFAKEISDEIDKRVLEDLTRLANESKRTDGDLI